MPVDPHLLPSWAPGPTREAIEGFLRAADDLPREQRVACFDNDGTLWVERPHYAQEAFLAATLEQAIERDRRLARRPEIAAVLSGDRAQLAKLGIDRVLAAMLGLYEGASPEEYGDAVRAFMETAKHPTLNRRLADLTYQPMRELLDALVERGFTVAIVTGGGAEFVRAFSEPTYGVPPERVVGTTPEYRVSRDDDGEIQVRRTDGIVGEPNEGAAKVSNIQMQLGRRPILAAGNSTGDREMLEWATSGDGPGLALLIDHDDEERELAYTSRAETVAEQEPIVAVAERRGWTTVSMRQDWTRVFAD